MNNIDELTEQYKDKYPHLKSYTECITRTYLSGIAATFMSKYIQMSYAMGMVVPLFFWLVVSLHHPSGWFL